MKTCQDHQESVPEPIAMAVSTGSLHSYQKEKLESPAEKKTELLNIYSQEGQRGADQRRVSELMTLTYEPQRRDIDATPPLGVSVTERVAIPLHAEVFTSLILFY